MKDLIKDCLVDIQTFFKGIRDISIDLLLEIEEEAGLIVYSLGCVITPEMTCFP
ncbi:MAG: hypothetical protein V3R28_00055 [Desulfatiglandales bacterium]